MMVLLEMGLKLWHTLSRKKNIVAAHGPNTLYSGMRENDSKSVAF